MPSGMPLPVTGLSIQDGDILVCGAQVTQSPGLTMDCISSFEMRFLSNPGTSHKILIVLEENVFFV